MFWKAVYLDVKGFNHQLFLLLSTQALGQGGVIGGDALDEPRSTGLELMI